MASRKIEVEIIGDASSLERAFGRGRKAASGFQKGINSASKVAGVALGALGVAAKIGLDELANSEKVTAQTNQALKTTGGVANVTAQHIADLATAIEHKSGIDDEAVRSSENLLLSFQKVRNEAGAGNDVFDRATKVIQDYATRTGKDAAGATLQFGKALEDPVGKLGALARAGVTFTEQQKEQIKALVEAGDQMGAQKVILSSLEERYGGAAEAAGKTFAGQLAIAKEEGKDFAAELVSGAIPSLTALGKGLQTATAFLSEHQTATKAAIAVVAALSVGVLAVRAAMAVAAAATAVWTAAQWLLNVALTANPVGLVIVAIAALAAGIVVAYKQSETFRTIVTAAFNAVKAVVGLVIAGILTEIDLWLHGLQLVFSAASHLPFVGDKFRGVADAIGGARSQVRSLRDEILGLPDKKTIEVQTIFTTVGQAYSGAGSFVSKAGVAVGPHRAAGGPVTAGMAYTVGERGEETFVPSTDGVILPAGGGVGGGDVYQFSFPNYVGDKAELERVVVSALKRVNSKGNLLLADLR